MGKEILFLYIDKLKHSNYIKLSRFHRIFNVTHFATKMQVESLPANWNREYNFGRKSSDPKILLIGHLSHMIVDST